MTRPHAEAHQRVLLHCRQVRDHWRNGSKRAFLLLTATEQWALSAYFARSEKLTDTQLIAHREDVSFLDPPLPQRAGRALTKLWAVSERLEKYRAQVMPMPRPRMKKNAEKRVVISSEVRPVLDPAKFAQILMNYKRRDQ